MTYTNLLFNRQRQLGAFSIMTAFTLLMLLMFLVLVLDSGRLYLEQRKLQKVADTAALGALLLLPDGNCSTDRALTRTSAEDNAKANGFDLTGSRKLTLQCADITQVDGLRVVIPNSSTGRAVEVTVSNEVPSSLILQVGRVFNSSLPDDIVLQATAVAARDEPAASFSVASQLLRLNNNKLLGRLLETVGLNPEVLTLLDQHGAANLNITPSGLLAALGVKADVDLRALTAEGIADLMLDADLANLNLVTAAIKAIEDSAVAINPQLLGVLNLLGTEPLIDKLDLNLLLFDSPDSRGIISLLTPRADDPVGSALDAEINLGDLLSTAILVGAKAEGRALQIGSPHDTEDSALKLLRTVQVELGIVEPPSIGIGPVGTTAYNAQIRLKIDVNTSAGLLGGLLNLLGTHIHLPIIIDLANATGELTALSCDGPDPEATIEVTSALGAVCVGHMPDTMWSTASSCNDEGAVVDQSLVKVLGLLDIHGSVNLEVLPTHTAWLDFSQQELLMHKAEDPPKPYTLDTGEYKNPLHLGSLVSDLVKEVLGLLESADIPDELNEEQARTLAAHYLKSSSDDYTAAELDNIRTQLEKDEINWSRAVLIDLGLVTMTSQWQRSAKQCPNTGTLLSPRYAAGCVADTLANALQTEATTPLLGGLLSALQPVLQALLSPILDIVEILLNLLGEFVLAPLLDDLLGLELNRTYVTLHDMACGAPRLVH